MEGVDKKETLPPRFRFHPTDEELITYYLTHKMAGTNFTGRAIADVDLNKCEPWDLPGKAKMGEKEWYFFCLLDRKYPTGVRTNRATNAGYWKTTGKDKEIFNSVTSELVGMKKTLVFYKGRAPRGEKTNWIMHEYRTQPKNCIETAKDEWVVCRVFQKSSGVKNQPTSQARTTPYNLDMGSSIIVAPVMEQMEVCHFDLADLTELTTVFRTPSGANLPIQQPTQLIYPAGGFTLTLPGKNLNLGMPAPPALRVQPPPLNQTMAATPSPIFAGSTELTGGGTCPDMHHNGGTRLQNMDPCGVHLDGYWPTLLRISGKKFPENCNLP